MACHRQFIIFSLSYLLLTACLCSQPTRSKRQKRGIMKMMMHIMWDPVRLIRYWYAYDVTKEIAKSWRKIIPTIMLLPITQHMPHSYGLAKYVHPTVGVRDSSKKYPKVKNPGPIYKGSSVNIRPMAVSPSVHHQVLPSQYDTPPIQYYSSKGIENTPKYKHQSVPKIILGHMPYENGKGDDNEYSIAHYFVQDGSSREENPASDAFLPAQIDHNAEDIRSSSNRVITSSDSRKNLHNFVSIPQNEHGSYSAHTLPHISLDDKNAPKVSQVLHPGQEVHIVLHPIPVGSSHGDSRNTPDDQAENLLPVQTGSNGTYGINLGTSPILLKAFYQNTMTQSDKFLEDHKNEILLPTVKNEVTFNLNSSENSADDAKENISKESSKYSVIWIPQQNSNLSRRADKKGSHLQSDGSTKRVVSVHVDYSDKCKHSKDKPKNDFAIGKHNINMERLREDLKHGTPVLIPFNRNTYSPEISSNSAVNNKSKFPKNNYNQEKDNHSFRTHSLNLQESLKVPPVSEPAKYYTDEQSDDKNATQKLLLFLTKKKHL